MKKDEKKKLKAAQAEIAKLRKQLEVSAQEPMKIEHGTAARMKQRKVQQDVFATLTDGLKYFKAAEHPAQATPSTGKMAMDAWETAYGSWAGASISSAYAEGQEFLGYPQLSLMAQRGEYRTIVTVLATEMTRKWIKIKSVSDDRSKQDKINQLDKFMKKLRVRQKFKRAAELDFYFGRGHLFLEFGGIEQGIDPEETKHSVGWGDDNITRGKVSRANPLTRIQPVEPVWVYPMSYNTNDPLDPNWYRPEHWFVLGKQVHSTRLLRFVMDEVADLLKPAYSFGGLSKTQIAKPYVDNWLYARQSVADLLRSFTTYVLKTNLMATLKDGGQSLYERLEIFANLRDNSGVMAVDFNSEDFSNVSAPLGGIDRLQGQAQEQICSISRIPLVKYTGITPSGLNASSDGELQAFGETIKSYQEAEFEDNLRTIFHHCQMSIWDAVDEDLDFEFLPLAELSELDKASKRSADAQTDATYIEAGAVDAMEVRQRLAKDPDTLYPGLDADKRPEQPQMPGMGGEEGEEDPDGSGGPPQQKGSPGGGNSADPFDNLRRLAAKPESSQESSWGNLALLAHDEFREGDHPRGPDGRWGKGGNGTQNLKMERVTERKGSNPGGVFKTAEGAQHYVKFYKNPQQGKVEQLASHLFERIGAATPSPRMAVVNGEQALISEWNDDVERLKPADFAKLNDKQQKQVAKMYLGAVLTKNWDVVGLEHDNIVRDKTTGEMMEVDTGGAFHFRAMGGAKPYGPDIAEFESLRDPKLPSGDVFNKIFKQNPKALSAAVDAVKNLNMPSIKQDFADSGLDNQAELYDAFAARRQALLKRTSSMGQDRAFYRRWFALDDAQFSEYEHPREKNGQFSKVPYQGVKELKKWHGAPKTEGTPHPASYPYAYQNKLIHKSLGHKPDSIPAKIVNQMLSNEGGLIEAAHIAQKQYGNSEEKTVNQLLAHMNNIKKGFEKGGAAKHGLTLLKHKWNGKVYYGIKHQETVKKEPTGSPVESEGPKVYYGSKGPTEALPEVPLSGGSVPDLFHSWKAAKLTGGNWEKQQLAKVYHKLIAYGAPGATKEIEDKLDESYALNKSAGKTVLLDKPALLAAIKANIDEANGKTNTPNPGAPKPAAPASTPAPDLKTKINKEIESQGVYSKDAKARAAISALAEHMNGLGGNYSGSVYPLVQHAAAAYTHATTRIGQYNLKNITPEEGAYIYLYSGSHYSPLNKQLRQGKTTKGTWAFAQKLNKALSKLPDHKGIVKRGTEVDPSVYEVGMVIEERGFTSTSTAQGFGGSVNYRITSKTGKSIRRLSGAQHEEEVLFRSGTRFEVTKVENAGHGSATIHMTEMTDDDVE